MKTLFKTSALALAASGMALSAVPASAANFHAPGYSAAQHDDSWDRHRRNQRYSQYGYGNSRHAYDEPVYRNTRVWRGNDGRTYCSRSDGTTGLIIGGAAGALLGRGIDTRGDRSLGTLLGAAAGALLGKEVAQGGSRCR